MKNKTKFFAVFIATIILVGIGYLYLSNDNQEKEVTTIPEEERILVKDGCEVGGCSGQICGEKGKQGGSFCDWNASYACYRDSYTTCERQSSGRCAWTNTPEFRACLTSPPSSIN